jgi:hypothetical protein
MWCLLDELEDVGRSDDYQIVFVTEWDEDDDPHPRYFMN